MRSPRFLTVLVLGAAAFVRAQPEPPKKPPPQPMPPDLVLTDLRGGYSHTTADEVAVKFRPPAGSGASERTDTFIIRIDAGDVASAAPRAVLLELGALRIHLSAGKLTAINTSAPDKVLKRDYAEPLSPATLAKMLPPLPLPQLALFTDPKLRSPLASLHDVTWEGAIPDEAARPPVVVMKGASPSGTAELTMNIQSRRLTHFAGTIRRGAAEGTLDLSIKAVEPGDPVKWVINEEGRHAVAALSDLKPSTKPLSPVEAGQAAPNFTLSRFDMSGWTLYEAIDRPGMPVALLLFRYPVAADRAEAALRNAHAGLAALRAAHQGAAREPAPPRFSSASGVIIDLGEFTRDRWDQIRKGWGTDARSPAGGPDGAIGADDLMWTSAAAQSIDRIAPAATGVIAVIRLDHTVAAVIPLDGRADKVSDITAEVLKAIRPQ